MNSFENQVFKIQCCCVDLGALDLVVSSVTSSIQTLPVLSQISFRVLGLFLFAADISKTQIQQLNHSFARLNFLSKLAMEIGINATLHWIQVTVKCGYLQ